MKKRIAIGLLALGAFACSGDDDDPDAGPQYEEPQIITDPSPICLSYQDVTVGDRVPQPVTIDNEGRKTLEVTSAEIVDDEGGNFEFEDVRLAEGMSCSEATPCPVVFGEEAAIARFFYTPQAPGWHTANLLVRSNAQNYPNLRSFILARAAPANLDGGVWDAGPKPAAATMGGEACPDSER